MYDNKREREHLYTRRERRKALEAGEFIKNKAYPTETEAIAMIRDGNVKDIPHTVDQVRAFYDIYGTRPAILRGKMTNKKYRHNFN